MPWTRAETGRVTINLLIRLGLAGFAGYHVVGDAEHGRVWALVVWAFVGLVALIPAVLIAAGIVVALRAGRAAS